MKNEWTSIDMLVIGVAFLLVGVMLTWDYYNPQKPSQNWQCIENKTESVCSGGLSYYDEECDKYARYLGLQPDEFPCSVKLGEYCMIAPAENTQSLFKKCWSEPTPLICNDVSTCIKEGMNCNKRIAEMVFENGDTCRMNIFGSEEEYTKSLNFCYDIKSGLWQRGYISSNDATVLKYIDICKQTRDVK